MNGQRASLYRWARDLTKALGASLSLVHALSAVDETSDNRGEVEVRRYLLSQAHKSFSARFAAEPEPVSVSLRGGGIATVVREAALAEHADLVVIGRGHLDRALGRLRTSAYWPPSHQPHSALQSCAFCDRYE
ncbi:MAG: universal stress protein [Bryobacteraceae bacterium]